MASRSERIKLLAQAIGADIKSILAKTNLLKTAAYKDVGTTAGTIPQFVGVNGLGGFGYGGEAIKLAAGSDLNLLPRVNALYTAAKNDNILNRPIELVNYVFEHEFVVECIVGRTGGSYGTYIQRLTFGAFPPEGTSTTNPVVFIRSLSYLGFSPWLKTTGRIYGVDVGGDVVGEDLVVNSIKAGATSPKVAFEKIRLDFTYENFGYAPDGITALNPNSDTRGYRSMYSTMSSKQILFLKANVYANLYGMTTLQTEKAEFSGTYFSVGYSDRGVVILAATGAHAIERDGNNRHSAQKLFDKAAYVELFVIYEVD